MRKGKCRIMGGEFIGPQAQAVRIDLAVVEAVFHALHVLQEIGCHVVAVLPCDVTLSLA